MNTRIGDRLFQGIPCRAAKFRENRPRDVEKSVEGKNKKTTMWANAQPNVGGALCSTPRSLAGAHYSSAVQ